MKNLLIVLSLSTVVLSNAEAPNFMYQVDPSDVKVSSKDSDTEVGGYLQISVKGEKIASDLIKEGEEADNGLVMLHNKVDYFKAVLQIANKHGSKVKIYEGTSGFKWIEPLDPAAHKEAMELMDWDWKKNSKIPSVMASLVDVSIGYCGTSSNSVEILVMGKAYRTLSFKNESDCRAHGLNLQSILRKSQPYRTGPALVMLYPGEGAYTWIEPVPIEDRARMEREKKRIEINPFHDL